MIRPHFPGKKFAQICGREKATEKMGIYRMCLCFTREFMDFEPKAPDDLREVFEKYTGGESHMTPEQLRRFIIDEGGVSEEKAVEEVMRRRKRHHHHNHHHRHHHISLLTSILNRDLLTLEDFLSCFLFSVDLNPPIISQVRQDKMTAPLSHYFIYTGHNSYLTGNQLSSNSSDVPIIKALKRGVRAIELDLWPNSSKDDVHVLHGRTLTPPVDLPKCLKSIKEHAFSASPYPLILTLEDHLTPDLQARVAQMITEIFGEMLFFPESECFKELPSPEQLKYRIIISTKLPKNNAVSYSSSSGGSQGKGGSSVNLAAPFIQVQSSKEDEVGSTEGSDLSNPIEGDDSDKDSVTSSPSRPPVYKRLISIPTIPRHNVKKALKLDLGKVARLSLSEESFEKAATTYGEDLVRFTQKNILRIFPKLTRINSSNYKPFHGWTHGAQMVAFNMQGHGKFLWWMQGMFRANGGCGYVKKPDFLLNLGPDDKILFDPKANLPVKTSLKVKVYMGYGWNLDFKQTHFDAYSPPDFYTKVGIAGVPADEAMKKTKIKGDQCWDEEFEFPLRVPELALLRIEVRKYNISKKDDIAGQTCLPIWELRPGTRAVPLYSHKGVRYESVKLLVRFQLT